MTITKPADDPNYEWVWTGDDWEYLPRYAEGPSVTVMEVRPDDTCTVRRVEIGTLRTLSARESTLAQERPDLRTA